MFDPVIKLCISDFKNYYIIVSVISWTPSHTFLSYEIRICLFLYVCLEDEEKNGYVARDQLLYALYGLMPGEPDKASARRHVGTRTN